MNIFRVIQKPRAGLRKLMLAAGLCAGLSACACLGDRNGGDFPPELVLLTTQPSNQAAPDRMLLVLSAPSIHDTYYRPAFELIKEFQINYAKSILGNDNVVILVDADTLPHYSSRLPADVLLTEDVRDIWMRDFTTANPLAPRQFTYTSASMTPTQSREVQNSFIAFANRYGIERTTTTLQLDGGNLVDDYAGKVITTTRFLTDNALTAAQGKAALKNLLGATQVAIVDPDEPVLAHSDGMVMWLDDKTLLVNNYAPTNAALRTSVLNELTTSFPGTKIIEVPVQNVDNPPGQWTGFSSACGVNVNSVLTYKNIYVPTFAMSHDSAFLDIVRANTNKKIIPVDRCKL